MTPKKLTDPVQPCCISIHRSKNGQFYVRYRAQGNWEKLSRSETLTSKANAIKNIKAMGSIFDSYFYVQVMDHTAKGGPKLIEVRVS